MSRSVYESLPIDIEEIPQYVLNIENKSQRNPLPWNGQFSPQFISALLDRFSSQDSIVLDPFLGSGTTLLECGKRGITSTGCEINPAAITLARLYCFINTSPEKRKSLLQIVDEILHKTIPDYLPLFNSRQTSGDLSEQLIQEKLIQLSSSLEDSNQRRLVEAVIVLADFHKANFSLERVYKAWTKVRSLVEILPFSDRPIDVYHTDARQLPHPASSVNLVITSPPYINVFNYHQRYRASIEALDWNVLQIAKSEFGSNRKHRSNRFLTVIQFCLDIAQSLQELARVCEPESRVIFIVGRESSILGTPFFNGEIVAEVANQVTGFNLILRQERVFTNRYGEHIYEDILHFQLPSIIEDKDALLDRARSVAHQTLEATYMSSGSDQRKAIQSAILEIANVQPSPMFSLSNSRKNETEA